jgi:hypothetical protein
MIRGSSRLIVVAVGAALASAPGTLRAQSGGTGEPPLRFNGDPYADLAIGAPYGWVGAVQAGVVNVLHGSYPGGLTASQSQLWDQSVLGRTRTAPRPGTSSATRWRSPTSTAIVTSTWRSACAGELMNPAPAP